MAWPAAARHDGQCMGFIASCPARASEKWVMDSPVGEGEKSGPLPAREEQMSDTLPEKEGKKLMLWRRQK